MYVSKGPEKSVFKRPVKELKGFEKVALEPQNLLRVSLPVDKYSTAVWDEKRDAWACEKGIYTVMVSAGDQSLSGTFEIARTVYWNGL
jgi:beta-glucosidase